MLGWDVAAALPGLRAHAESLMSTSLIIRRKGADVRDPETGTMVPSWTTVYEGPCRVRFTNADPHESDQSGQRVAQQSPTVWLPIATSAGVRLDDVGEILANPDDLGIVGVTFRVAGEHAQTHSTSRRLPVEVLSFA